MAKRNEPVRSIIITIPTYERFQKLPPYKMPNESILLWLMDEYEKLHKFNKPTTIEPK